MPRPMISQTDRETLRNLADHQASLASAPRMDDLRKNWIDHHSERPSSPIVTIEAASFADEIVRPMLNCKGAYAREIEYELFAGFLCHELFCDDSVVKDYFPVVSYHSFLPFGLPVKRQQTSGIGHHFVEQLQDLEKDFHILKDSVFTDNKKMAAEKYDITQELFGDILPSKIIGASLVSCPTQDLVHIMGMETMFLSMTDYPELFKKMMGMLTDDYMKLFDYLEAENSILPTTDGEMLCNGSYSYNDFLPSSKTPGQNFRTQDVWGFMDSQETVGVSPEMFDEFIFPSYKKIAARFACLSYGCCEPVDPIWEPCLSKLDNLRKLSISPWCKEEFIGEALRGRDIIYFRKPSPNFIGLGTVLDEVGVAMHFARTVKAAQGCKLEISQRDVYTINRDIGKVRRYVELIRKELEKHQN